MRVEVALSTRSKARSSGRRCRHSRIPPTSRSKRMERRPRPSSNPAVDRESGWTLVDADMRPAKCRAATHDPCAEAARSRVQAEFATKFALSCDGSYENVMRIAKLIVSGNGLPAVVSRFEGQVLRQGSGGQLSHKS